MATGKEPAMGRGMTRDHTEWIECPRCGALQEALIVHTVPFYTYLHTCSCGYEIMESEWQPAKNGKGDPDDSA